MYNSLVIVTILRVVLFSKIYCMFYAVFAILKAQLCSLSRTVASDELNSLIKAVGVIMAVLERSVMS